MKHSNILYSTGNTIGDCYVIKVDCGYEVYKNGVTHAFRVAQVGYKGEVGLGKAIEYANQKKTPGKI